MGRDDSRSLLFYNRYWNTGGGGEFYAMRLLGVLSDYFDVELLVDRRTELSILQERYAFDFEQIKRRVVYNANDHSAELLSAEYPAFVNSTYLTTAFNRAARGVLVSFFPLPVFSGAPAVSEPFRCGAGFYFPDKGNRVTFRNFGSPAEIWVAPGARAEIELTMVLTAGPTPLSWITVSSEVDTVEVEISRTPRKVRIVVPESTRPRRVVLFGPVWRAAGNSQGDSRRISGALVIDPAAISPWDGLKSIISYDQVVGISRFTSDWITRRWGVKPETLPPPVRMYQPGKKEPIILAVGRFFEGGHSKKQLEMVTAFRRVSERLPGWRLVLVGGVSDRDRSYLNKVVEAAKGSPVDVLPNASAGEVETLLAKASIFWHLTGLGEDAERHPERLEHFGIAPVEAMSAGCVPIAAAGAGPSEVLRNGVSGFLIGSLDELCEVTLRLAESDELRARIAQAAIKESALYNDSHFRQRIESFMVPLLNGAFDD